MWGGPTALLEKGCALVVPLLLRPCCDSFNDGVFVVEFKNIVNWATVLPRYVLIMPSVVGSREGWVGRTEREVRWLPFYFIFKPYCVYGHLLVGV